jgi:hypothetical protein
MCSEVNMKRIVIALCALTVAAAFVAGGCGSGSKSSKKAAAPTTTKPADVTDMDGFTCPPKKAKYGRCPGNAYYGKKPAQVRALKRAKARAEARARAAAVARARAKAAAHAEAVREANAWHAGYEPVPTDSYDSNPGAYVKFLDPNSFSCDEFAEYGCWKVEVAVRDGCPSYVGVEANEYKGGAIVNDLLDNNGTGVPPKTPVVFELDASQDGTTVNDVKVQCD